MKRFIVFFVALPILCFGQVNSGTNVLYDKVLSDAFEYPELIGEGLNYTQEGLQIQQHEQLVRLNYYYSIARRLVRYHVRMSADAKAIFQSDRGDFKASVDMQNRQIAIETSPGKGKKVDFLNPGHEYLVELYRDYQTSGVRLIDLYTGESDEVYATMDGSGGVGQGSEQIGFYVGLQHDYYCFGLQQGATLLVKQMTVTAKESNLLLLMYGDSITEPESYYPTVDFPEAWTQLIINNMNGKAVSSGRGGTTIHELLDRIKNELPYVKAKYVMVTIGTNGGNTEENLSELVEYIQSQGAIPILNNIPANERNTHVEINKIIESVRQKYAIKGCRFDVATSLHFDGKEVDKTTMYFEDYDWGKIYHHPNVKGSRLMYLRTLVDVPEIYE